MARKRIIRMQAWLWSSVLSVMGLCVAGCPTEPPVVEYDPAPMYGIPVTKLVVLADMAETGPTEAIEEVSMEQS